MGLANKHDAIVVIAPSDYLRVRANFERILSLTGVGHIVFAEAKR